MSKHEIVKDRAKNGECAGLSIVVLNVIRIIVTHLMNRRQLTIFRTQKISKKIRNKIAIFMRFYLSTIVITKTIEKALDFSIDNKEELPLRDQNVFSYKMRSRQVRDESACSINNGMVYNAK